MRFRATLRPLFCPNEREVYLNYCKVLIKHFKGFAQGLRDRVKKLAYDRFQQAGRPNIYLPSLELGKEALIQDLVAKEWGPRNTRKDAKWDDGCGLGGPCHIARPDIGQGTRSCAIRRGMSKNRATAIFDLSLRVGLDVCSLIRLFPNRSLFLFSLIVFW